VGVAERDLLVRESVVGDAAASGVWHAAPQSPFRIWLSIVAFSVSSIDCRSSRVVCGERGGQLVSEELGRTKRKWFASGCACTSTKRWMPWRVISSTLKSAPTFSATGAGAWLSSSAPGFQPLPSQNDQAS